MFIPHTPQFYEDAIDRFPVMWYGTDTVDGDAQPWISAPIGSTYVYTTAGSVARYTKLTDVGDDGDWAIAGTVVITETVALADFTDGGSTSGTYDLVAGTIPIGARVIATLVSNVTGFAGDTSATLTVGDGTDVDRYNTGTPDVFSTATAVDMGAVSGTATHTTAATVTLTVTSATDFTSVTAGALTIHIHYLI